MTVFRETAVQVTSSRHYPRITLSPANTNMIDSTIDPATYRAASHICPLFQSSTTSRENAEKVVYPPRRPVVRKRLVI